MKKRFISLCLTLALTAAPAGAAFSDISSGSLQQTASILGSLGIMQGTGNNRFEPNRPLTRAEFCKLAVTAMGIDDASPYASYTIFPDVHASHWAARYVNAALRHPDFKDNYIIRGYADGTFGPDRQLTYGEVCTMLLRMLGYKESDIGPFWPADYIAQANALGLTQGVSIKDAKTPVTRADAATMLLNTLGTSTRSDGQEGSPLISRVSSSTVENCILLETSETDSSLAADEALFYENGLKNVPWNNLTKEAQQNHVDDGSSTHPSTVDNVSWNELTKDAQDEYRKNHPSSYKYYVVLNHWDTTEKKKIEASYKVLDLPSGLSGGPIAVPKGYSTDESIVNTSLDIKKLKLIDTVDRTAFDGASGVRTKDGYYALADQLGIYDTENRDFIATLQSAKSNYTKFALYANDTAEDGGKIRIITVSNK